LGNWYSGIFGNILLLELTDHIGPTQPVSFATETERNEAPPGVLFPLLKGGGKQSRLL
jgi:hypothetical protein